MHDYSIDKHPKQTILFILAFLAIAIAPTLKSLVEAVVDYLQVSAGWSYSPVIAVPVFGLFSLIYFLFNKYLWRVGWLRKRLLVPDLNGVWQCQGHTVIKDGNPVDFDWESTITITQSWSKILIHLQTGQSESKSISASIYHESGVGYRLLYQYNNRPNVDELDLSNHSGTCELLFSEDASSASGSYYTDRHRTTVGTMTINKKG